MTNQEFEFDISISAKGEREADLKMDALLAFAKRFTAKQLQGLKRMIKSEPEKVEFLLDTLGL